MDHPVNPNYQFLVLSGPYVKWEVKLEEEQQKKAAEPSGSTPRANTTPILLGVVQSV